MHRRVGAREFGKPLAAAATWRGQPAVYPVRHHGHGRDAAARARRPGRHHMGDGRGFGAPSFGKGAVLHVSAGVNGAILGAQCRAYMESGVWRMSQIAYGERFFKEPFVHVLLLCSVLLAGGVAPAPVFILTRLPPPCNGRSEQQRPYARFLFRLVKESA